MRTIHLHESEKFNLVLHLGPTPTTDAHVRSFIGASASGMTLPDDDATGLVMPPRSGLTIRFSFDEALEPNDEPYTATGAPERGALRSAIIAGLEEAWNIDPELDFADLLNTVFELDSTNASLCMHDDSLIKRIREVHLTMQCEAAMADIVKATTSDPMRALEVLRAAGITPDAPQPRTRRRR